MFCLVFFLANMRPSTKGTLAKQLPKPSISVVWQLLPNIGVLLLIKLVQWNLLLPLFSNRRILFSAVKMSSQPQNLTLGIFWIWSASNPIFAHPGHFLWNFFDYTRFWQCFPPNAFILCAVITFSFIFSASLMYLWVNCNFLTVGELDCSSPGTRRHVTG